MRLKRMLLLLGLGAAVPGCTPLANVAKVCFCQPAAYCLGMDEWVSKCHDAALAEDAWAQYQAYQPDACYSDDFVDGFKAGFADYLYAGGTGEPPPVPPRTYWKAQYESPLGQQMMQDWFTGFRQGSAVARASGYREAITVPASTSLPRTMPPPPSTTESPKAMPGADEPMPGKEPAGKQSPDASAQPLSGGAPVTRAIYSGSAPAGMTAPAAPMLPPALPMGPSRLQ
jgi:hypothetical protein